MKNRLIMIVLPSVLLPALVLATGCDKKAAEVTPEKKAQFGTYNQPMPPEARAAMAKEMQKRGGSAGAPPGPAAPK